MDSKEMISEAKLELENIDMVIDVKHNPVISAFISLMKEMPFIGDLIDDSLESVLSDFQSKKQQKLLEVIGQASLGTVTSDMVNDVEFIMAFPFNAYVGTIHPKNAGVKPPAPHAAKAPPARTAPADVQDR